MKLSFILSFFLFISISSYSQKPTIWTIDSESFLPRYGAINVRDMECDQQGYLHLATNTGVYKFNGYQLTPSKKRTYDKSYSQIHKDHSGNLWFSGHLSVARLVRDSLLPYSIPQEIIKLGKNGYESIYYDAKQILHLAPIGHGHYAVDSLGNSQMLFEGKDTIKGYVIQRLNANEWFHYSVFSKDERPLSIYYQDYSGKLKLICKTDETKPNLNANIVQHQDENYSLLLDSNLVIQFNEDQLIDSFRFPTKVTSLFIDKKNSLWVSTLNHGTYSAKNAEFDNLEHYIFPNNGDIVAETYDGGLWINPMQNGFNYIPKNRFLNYGSQNGYPKLDKAYTVYPVGDSLLIGSLTGHMHLYYQDKIIPIRIPKENLSDQNTELTPFLGSFHYDEENHIFWFSFEKQILKWDGTTWTSFFLKNLELEEQIFSNLKPVDDKIIINSNKMLFEIKEDSIYLLSDTKLSQLRYFVVNDSKEYFIGQNGIISQFENGLFSPLESDVEIEDIFYMFNHENIIGIVSTQSGDLLRIKDKSIIPTIDQYGNQITLWNHSIAEDGTIWGVTRGLDLVHFSNFTEEHVVAEYFELPQYVCAGMMKNSVVVKNNHIYIASYNGFFIKELSSLEKILPPSKLVIQTQINGLIPEYKDSFLLDHNQNNLYIEFDAIGFNLWKNTYQYKFTGYDADWKQIRHNHIQYTNLDPGEYTFSLRSKISYGEWSSPQERYFFIAKPYWETWWFIGSVLLIISSLIYFIIQLRIRKVRNEEKEKSRIALELNRLEMRALKAQLNPHFIFNSISSAILHLSKKEYDQTTYYLKRFSRLLRKVLENSDQNVVKIAEEVELLSLYIQIESEHFEGEPISFDIVYEDIDPEEAYIQPTLLQPYIENAIHHGLKNKIGKRIIRLVFSLNKKELEIQIEDNGIGREAAKANGFYKDYKSYGMFISAKRIELLNKTNFSGIHIDDLENNKGEALGTRIRFNIPLSQ